MSRSEMDILDTSMIGPGLLFLNQYLDCIFNEYLVLWMCFVSDEIWTAVEFSWDPLSGLKTTALIRGMVSREKKI